LIILTEQKEHLNIEKIRKYKRNKKKKENKLKKWHRMNKIVKQRPKKGIVVMLNGTE
jgi:hypothetical protein